MERHRYLWVRSSRRYSWIGGAPTILLFPRPIPQKETSGAEPRRRSSMDLPPTARYCIASAKHKILCRGQKISDAWRLRQYLATDSVRPFYVLKYIGL